MKSVRTVAELKEMWREENWERRANGVGRTTWKQFTSRTWVRALMGRRV